MKRDSPRHTQVTLTQSRRKDGTDTKWFLIGMASTIVAGLFKVFLMDRFGK